MTGFSTDPRGLSRIEKIEQALLNLFSANGFLTTSGADASGDLIIQTGATLVERARVTSSGTVKIVGDGTGTQKQQLLFAQTNAVAGAVIDYKENTFGTPTVYDPSLYMGVNQDANGNLVTAGQPGLSWAVEGDYDDGTGTHKMEAYLQHLTAAEVATRPIFIQVNRDTGQTTAFTLSGTDVRIAAGAGEATVGATRMQVLGSTINFFPNTGTAHATGSKTIALISDGVSGDTFITMGSGATANAYQFCTSGTTIGQIKVNAKTVANFYQVGAGSGVAVAIGGVNSNGHMLYVDAKNRGDAAAPVLTLRAATTQTANILRTELQTGVLQFGVTGAGLPQWGASGMEQTTVGAAGAASALPAAPTKYLKIVDSGGTTLVIPAYVAA